jgi:hypothetical protein
MSFFRRYIRYVCGWNTSWGRFDESVSAGIYGQNLKLVGWHSHGGHAPAYRTDDPGFESPAFYFRKINASISKKMLRVIEKFNLETLASIVFLYSMSY